MNKNIKEIITIAGLIMAGLFLFATSMPLLKHWIEFLERWLNSL